MSLNGNPVSDFGLLDESQSFWQKIRKTQTAQILLVLIVITAIFSFLAPDTFFTLFNLRNIFINIAVFAKAVCITRDHVARGGRSSILENRINISDGDWRIVSARDRDRE
jgi:predicted ABC-type sugar transport system permease subunit